MINKDEIQHCINWIVRAAESAQESLDEHEYEDAIYVLEHWVIKDAKEAIGYLKQSTKYEEPN